jgi:hypothetical protein
LGVIAQHNATARQHAVSAHVARWPWGGHSCHRSVLVNKLVLWVVAIPAAIVASLFGFEMYRKVTDKRPMSVRIHEECVKRIGPADEPLARSLNER